MFSLCTADIPILPLLADIVKDLSPDGEPKSELSTEKEENALTTDTSHKHDISNTDPRSTSVVSAGGLAGLGGAGLGYGVGPLDEHLGEEPGGSSADDKALLGVTYAMNDMCFSIGFFLGPLVGTGVETAFGDGQTGNNEVMLNDLLCYEGEFLLLECMQLVY